MDSPPAPTNDSQAEAVSEDEEVMLKKHVRFFDFNRDGIIYPSDTYRGFRMLGSGYLLAIFAAFFIHVTLSFKTRPGKFPCILFPIVIRNIQRAQHGSDTGCYDNCGRFVHKKFDDIFKKYAKTDPCYLTKAELKKMLKANRCHEDYSGWIASWVEWKIFYKLCKDKYGTLHKETIRDVYDGSLFEKMMKDCYS